MICYEKNESKKIKVKKRGKRWKKSKAFFGISIYEKGLHIISLSALAKAVLP